MKPQKCWAIFSGKLMLPSTIRCTKQQAKQDYLNDVSTGYFLKGFKEGWLSCRKVIVTEFKK